MKLITQNENRPGYKETKIGWIPEEWEVKKIGQILSEKTLGGNYPNNEEERGLPLIKMGNLGRGEIVTKKVERIPISFSYDNNYILENGDILFNTRNTLDLVGKVAIWQDEFSSALYNSNILRLRFNKKNVATPVFANYLLNSNTSLSQLRGRATGTTSVAAIYDRDLLTVKLPLPPLPEQKKIAAILSTWDKAIEKTAALIAAKEQQKKGLMQRLLTGKARFPGFTEPWEEVRLGEVLKEVIREIDWDDNFGYSLVSVRRRSGGLFHRENLFGHQIKTKTLKEIISGDFLISKMQIVHGASGLTTKKFDGMYVSGSYHCLIPKNETNLDIIFFKYFSQTKYFYHLTYLASHGVHIEKMTFKLSDFFKLKVQMPYNIKEQQQIAAVLSDCEKEIELLKKEKAALEQQKKGLMQKLLTGSVRVKVGQDYEFKK